MKTATLKSQTHYNYLNQICTQWVNNPTRENLEILQITYQTLLYIENTLAGLGRIPATFIGYHLNNYYGDKRATLAAIKTFQWVGSHNSVNWFYSARRHYRKTCLNK